MSLQAGVELANSGLEPDTLQSVTDLSRIISAHKPGDQVQVELIRDGEHETIDVTLQPRPGDA